MALGRKKKDSDSEVFLASLVNYIQSPKFYGNGPQLGRRLTRESEQKLSVDLELNLDQQEQKDTQVAYENKGGSFL